MVDKEAPDPMVPTQAPIVLRVSEASWSVAGRFYQGNLANLLRLCLTPSIAATAKLPLEHLVDGVPGQVESVKLCFGQF